MIKDIVVHLDGSPADGTRIAYAEGMAGLSGATIIGLHVHMLPEAVAMSDPTGAQYLQALFESSTAEADRVDTGLGKAFAGFAGPSELRRVDVFPSSLSDAVASQARAADMFVALRPYGQGGGDARLGEAVLFNSGRSCLFVPPSGRPPSRYEQVAVAWKDTVESARAVAEAMPILKAAAEVQLILVAEGEAEEARGEAAGADIARHLGRHGVNVEVRPVSGWSDVGEAILNEVRRAGSQLIVMGGYGHARVWQWVVGGTTRRVLTEADVPVLMAH